MTSIIDDIKSFFLPSVEKCTKEEKKENDKHDAKVKEENERHETALQKLKETASCKLKTPDTKKETQEPKPSSSLFNFDKQEPPKTPEPEQEPPKTPEPEPEPEPSYFDKLPPPPPQQIQERPRPQELPLKGGKRTRRARKNKRKNTKRSY